MKGKYEQRIAKAKRDNRSPYPRTAVIQKHVNKQGFPNTRGKKG